MTADGEVRIANACVNPDLFWALKGGGGGFGVVTRVTLRTHDLPEFFGVVFASDQGDLRRRLSPARRQDGRVLRASALQSALGRADRFAPGGVSVDFDGVPGPRPATGRGDVASVLRLGRRFASGFRSRVGAEDHRRAGAAFLGPVRAQDVPGRRPRRRSPGRAGGQYLLGRKPRGSGRGLARLSIRLAARVASRDDQREHSPTRCSRRRSIRA